MKQHIEEMSSVSQEPFKICKEEQEGKSETRRTDDTKREKAERGETEERGRGKKREEEMTPRGEKVKKQTGVFV